MQKPNRTLLPKSPFSKGGLLKQFLASSPPLSQGGLYQVAVIKVILAI